MNEMIVRLERRRVVNMHQLPENVDRFLRRHYRVSLFPHLLASDFVL